VSDAIGGTTHVFFGQPVSPISPAPFQAERPVETFVFGLATPCPDFDVKHFARSHLPGRSTEPLSALQAVASPEPNPTKGSARPGISATSTRTVR